jgi:hypothetical protein
VEQFVAQVVKLEVAWQDKQPASEQLIAWIEFLEQINLVYPVPNGFTILLLKFVSVTFGEAWNMNFLHMLRTAGWPYSLCQLDHTVSIGFLDFQPK